MIKTYRKLFALLDDRERRNFCWLTGIMLLVAAAEISGFSAVLMLLNVISAPEKIQSNAVLSFVYTRLGFTSIFQFQVALAISVLSALL